MLLALDVGNTNTVLGLYRLDDDSGGAAVAATLPGDDGAGSPKTTGRAEPKLAAHWRVTTHRAQTSDEYGVLFVNLFNMSGISVQQVKHIIISSVVPPVETTLRRVCEKYFHLQPLFVEPGIKTGMPVTHLQSGLYYGYIGLVDGILERMIGELGTPARVIATGGLARQISADSRYIAQIDDMLTLDGLRILFERNRAARPRSRGH